MKKATSRIAVILMGAVIMGAFSAQSLSKDVAENDSANKESAADENRQKADSLIDRFSYAYGMDLAGKFKDEGIELNTEFLAEAMKAVFDGEEKRMSADEVAATLEEYRVTYMEKKDAEWAIAAEKNKKEGAAFLAKNANKKGVVVTESGLQYKIITEGSGDYRPSVEDEIKVHYRGTFIDGTEFDSSYQRNEAHSAKVKQLIDGWVEALQMMTTGAKWELTVPAELAYGEKGSGKWVGPNAVLIFEVELIEIEKKS